MSKVQVQKILVIHWGRTGAGPRLCYELSTSLNDLKEFEVVVSHAIDTEWDNHFDQAPFDTRTIRTYRNISGLLFFFPRALSEAIKLRRLIKKDGICAVVSPMVSIWQTLVIPLLLPNGTPYIATVHDAQPHPGENNFFFRWIVCRDQKLAAIRVTFSHSVTTKLLSVGRFNRGSIVETVHPAFIASDGSIPVQRELASNRPIIVGMFGRIRPYKGIEIFGKAVRQLRDEGMNIQGLVVGSGDSDLALRMTEEFGITIDNRWVPEKETNKVVRQFDLLILPYIEASQSGPLAIALAEGVPVIGTPVGGLIEQIGNTRCGLISDRVDSVSIATSIRTMLNSPELYKECSGNAITAAEHEYSWQRVAGDYGRAINKAQKHKRK